MLDPHYLSGLSSGAPLPREVIYPVSTPIEEDDDIADPFTVFEHRRKAFLAEHLNSIPPIILITLKSERARPPPDPHVVKNVSYLKGEVSKSDRRPSKPLRATPSRDVEFEFNRSWIEAVSMDLDEDYPLDFLAQLPDAPQAPRPIVQRRTALEQSQMEDPVEQAFQIALAETEPREPSAEELTREWGFEDKGIAKTIQRVMHRR
jgi:hypothetical protein